MSFEEWLAEQNISPVSPEATAATDAWNAAVEQMKKLVEAGAKAEPTVDRLAVLLLAELEGMGA